MNFKGEIRDEHEYHDVKRDVLSFVDGMRDTVNFKGGIRDEREYHDVRRDMLSVVEGMRDNRNFKGGIRDEHGYHDVKRDVRRFVGGTRESIEICITETSVVSGKCSQQFLKNTLRSSPMPFD